MKWIGNHRTFLAHLHIVYKCHMLWTRTTRMSRARVCVCVPWADESVCNERYTFVAFLFLMYSSKCVYQPKALVRSYFFSIRFTRLRFVSLARFRMYKMCSFTFSALVQPPIFLSPHFLVGRTTKLFAPAQNGNPLFCVPEVTQLCLVRSRCSAHVVDWMQILLNKNKIHQIAVSNSVRRKLELNRHGKSRTETRHDKSRPVSCGLCTVRRRKSSKYK